MARKQTQIPGTERQSIKELDTAAEAYVDARDARMKKTERETEAREALIRVMKKHKLETYRDEEASPPLLVTLVPGEDKVKVASVKEDEAPEPAKRGRRVTSAAEMGLPVGDRE